MRLWSLPKDFHTCGKNCGNYSGCLVLLRFLPDIPVVFAQAKAEKPVNSAFSACRRA
jgi:hypothetical protein